MTNANRASRKSGNKSSSAQSANAAKITSAKIPNRSVVLQVIDVDGKLIPGLKIPSALYKSLRPHIRRGKKSAPVTKFADMEILPFNEDSSGRFTTAIEFSPDVFNQVCDFANEHQINIIEGFRSIVLRGLASAMRDNQLIKSMSWQLERALARNSTVR